MILVKSDFETVLDWDTWIEGGTGGEIGRTNERSHSGNYSVYLKTPTGMSYQKSELTNRFSNRNPEKTAISCFFQMPWPIENGYWDELCLGNWYIDENRTMTHGCLYIRPTGYAGAPYSLKINLGVEEIEIGTIPILPDARVNTESWNYAKIVCDHVNGRYDYMELNGVRYDLKAYPLARYLNIAVNENQPRMLCAFIWARSGLADEPSQMFYVDDAELEAVTPISPLAVAFAIGIPSAFILWWALK